MIEFRKNIETALPYNRQQYIDFFDDRADTSIEWYGISFQLPDADRKNGANFKEYVEKYLSLFKNVVFKLDSNSFWIVNHDDKDLNWLPNDADNLPHLRALFKQNDIPNTYKGAILFSMDDLLENALDLISYPYVAINREGFLYKDLDVSHSILKIVIKISGHLNIDFLSTDKGVLREIVSENSSNQFIIKEYRGTSIGRI